MSAKLPDEERRRTFGLAISDEEMAEICKAFPRGSKSESIRDAAKAGISFISSDTDRIERTTNA